MSVGQFQNSMRGLLNFLRGFALGGEAKAAKPTVFAKAEVPLRKYSDYELILEFFNRCRCAETSSVMVDVGAQIGLWSRAYVELGWTVIAFEPEDQNFAQLVSNIDNRRGNFDARKLAVSDTVKGAQKLYFSEDFIGIHSLEPNHRELSVRRFQEIEVSTLKDQLSALGEDNVIRFLKIDIEGAELPALRGFDFAIHQPEVIVCEFGTRSKSFGYSFSDLAAHGAGLGYKCIVSHKQSGSQNIIWLGDFEAERFAQIPATAWGDLIFVRPNVLPDFLDCLSAFEIDFELDPGLAAGRA